MASTLKPPVNLADSVDFRKRVVGAMWVKAYALATASPPSSAALLALAKKWIATDYGSEDCKTIANVVALNATVIAAGENNLDSVEGTIQTVVNNVAAFFAG